MFFVVNILPQISGLRSLLNSEDGLKMTGSGMIKIKSDVQNLCENVNIQSVLDDLVEFFRSIVDEEVIVSLLGLDEDKYKEVLTDYIPKVTRVIKILTGYFSSLDDKIKGCQAFLVFGQKEPGRPISVLLTDIFRDFVVAAAPTDDLKTQIVEWIK